MSFYKNTYVLFILLSLFGYPLSAGISEMLSISSDSSIISIIFRSFTLMLTFIFILNIFKNGKFSNINELSILTLFLLFYAFRMFIDFNIHSIYTAIPKSQYYIFYFLTLFLPSVLILSQRFPFDNMLVLFKNLKYIMFFALILNVVFGFQGYLESIALELTTIRVETTKLNPISLGQLAVSVLILLFYQKYFLELKFYFFDKFVFFISFIALALANSKGAMLTFVIVYLYIVYLKYGFKKTMFKNIIYFILGIVILSIILNFILDVNIFNRFQSMFNDSETSTTSRLHSYRDAFSLFLLSPIYGYSLVTSAGGYPHNIVLEVLMSMGIIGFLLFIFLICLTFISINIINKKKNEFIIFGLFFMQYLVTFQTSFAFWGASSLFIVMSIIFSIKNKFKDY